MIPLARVQFKEAVSEPGPELCIYPRPQDVFVSVLVKDERFQRSTTLDPKSPPKPIQRFELHLDGDFVVIKHPQGDWEERVHVSRTKQLTYLPERLRAKVKAA